MIEIIHAVILGIVQGATEFLPISSSGHLVLAEYFMGIKEASLVFDVALHLGTLIAVVIYFWADFWAIAMALWQWRIKTEEARAQRSLFLFICLGTLPGVIAGATLGKLAESHLRHPGTVALLLAAVGFLLLMGDRKGRKKRFFSDLTLGDALLIGLSQALAIMPGVSRSGITMTTGLFLGLNRQAVARFSFLLSAPIILGAGIFHVPAMVKAGMDGSQALFFASGMLAACLSGYLFIAFLMKYITTRTFAIFAYYRFILAAAVWLALALR